MVYLKPSAHERIGRAAPSHDAFLRPIYSCAGNLARQLASRAGGNLSNRFDILSSPERKYLVCGQQELLSQREN